MKKILTVFITAFIVAGCSAKIGNSKMESSESGIGKQMANATTKADVRKTFGTPNLVFDKDNAEVYEYKKLSASGRYHWMIPFFGWAASWWQDAYTYRETNLFIEFDKNDKVRDWRLVKTGGTTN